MCPLCPSILGCQLSTNSSVLFQDGGHSAWRTVDLDTETIGLGENFFSSLGVGPFNILYSTLLEGIHQQQIEHEGKFVFSLQKWETLDCRLCLELSHSAQLSAHLLCAHAKHCWVPETACLIKCLNGLTTSPSTVPGIHDVYTRLALTSQRSSSFCLPSAGITGRCHHPDWILYFETESCYVVQAGLKLASASLIFWDHRPVLPPL